MDCKYGGRHKNHQLLKRLVKRKTKKIQGKNMGERSNFGLRGIENAVIEMYTS